MAIGTVRIKVNPEAMLVQAEEVRRLANNMQAHFREIETAMENTKYYWIGEAGNAHRNLYMSQKNDIEKMMRRLLEHPTDLTNISKNYSMGERTNVQETKSLPSDVI